MQSAQFWNKIARKYATDKISDMEIYEKGLDMIRGYLSQDVKVIELGAGTSSTAIILAPLTKSYHSTDISSEMVKIGNEKLANESAEIQNRLSLSVFDPSMHNWTGEKADVLLGLNFLHLVPDVAAVLTCAHDMLEDDGIAIFKSACFSTPKKMLFLPLVWVMRQFGKAPHLNAFSFVQHKADVRAAGFEILDAYPVKKRALGHFVIARKT